MLNPHCIAIWVCHSLIYRISPCHQYCFQCHDFIVDGLLSLKGLEVITQLKLMQCIQILGSCNCVLQRQISCLRWGHISSHTAFKHVTESVSIWLSGCCDVTKRYLCCCQYPERWLRVNWGCFNYFCNLLFKDLFNLHVFFDFRFSPNIPFSQ